MVFVSVQWHVPLCSGERSQRGGYSTSKRMSRNLDDPQRPLCGDELFSLNVSGWPIAPVSGTSLHDPLLTFETLPKLTVNRTSCGRYRSLLRKHRISNYQSASVLSRLFLLADKVIG